jgi:AraC family transcriptional regulator
MTGIVSHTEAELAQDDVRVMVHRYDYPEPYERSFFSEDEYRLGMAFRPVTRFRAGFQGVGIEDRVQVRRPLLIPPGVVLQGDGGRGVERAVQLNFSRQRYAALTRRDADFSPAELRACLAIGEERVARTLARLAEEAATPGFASGLLLESLTHALIVEITRFILGAGRDAPGQYARLSRRQLALIEERAHAEGAQPDIAELAALCGLSPRQLIRLFKRTTGSTLHGYVEQVRLERARALLADTALPLKEISARLGFAAPSSFSIAFRRAAGISPRDWRRSARLDRGGRR